MSLEGLKGILKETKKNELKSSSSFAYCIFSVFVLINYLHLGASGVVMVSKLD